MKKQHHYDAIIQRVFAMRRARPELEEDRRP